MAVAVRNSSRRKSSGMMRNKSEIFEHVMSESESERKEKNRKGIIIFKRRRAEEWIGAVYFIFSGRELEKGKRVVLVF